MAHQASLLIAVLLVGCSSSLHTPDAADAQRLTERYPDASLAELETGRELYVARCAGCHTLMLPETVPSDAWRGQVLEMRGKGARLDDVETEAVVRYLESASAR